MILHIINNSTVVMKGSIKCNPGSVHELSSAPPRLYTPMCPESMTWNAPEAHKSARTAAYYYECLYLLR